MYLLVSVTNELVLNETFDIFNNSLWKHEVKIPLNPVSINSYLSLSDP